MWLEGARLTTLASALTTPPSLQLCFALTLCSAFWVSWGPWGWGPASAGAPACPSDPALSLQWHNKGLALIFCILQSLALTW